MFVLEESVKQWLKSLRKHPGLEDGYIAELHSHLLDEIDQLLEDGKNEKEAFETAVANLGPVETIGDDYYKTNTRRWLALTPSRIRDHFPALLVNYFKVALRRIKRHKGYALINILGLAIGMVCMIFIMKWVQNEISYDRFHLNADDLYVATFSNGSTVTPTALSKHLKTHFPEVSRTSRFGNMGENLFRVEKKELKAADGILAEADFLLMFSLSFLRGDPEKAFDEPHSIVISESLARQLFGKENPMGRTIVFNVNNDLKVTGIFRDYPSNSHIRCRYIIPLAAAKAWGWLGDMNTWNVNNIRTYVQLRKNTSADSVDTKISDLVEQHRPQDQRALLLQPITRLHLNPFGHSATRLIYVYIFSFMAFFILIIACINFMNLTTARSTTLAKEVGMRKVVGAARINLIRQFFGESLLLTCIASGIAVVLVALFLPSFNGLIHEAFTFKNLFDFKMLLGILSILLITGIIAGSYPSLFLSRIQTVEVLKGTMTSGLKGARFRKTLVVIQFSLSILLILGTIMIFKQVHYLKKQDIGYNKDNIIYFGIGNRFRKNYQTIKAEMLSHHHVESLTLTDVAPYRWQANAGHGDVDWEGKTSQKVKMVMIPVDSEYLKTFGMKMSEGRFFSEKFSTDTTDAFVINEAAGRAMELRNPLGKELKIWNFRGRIIGVVKDYHFESLHNPIIPMAMYIDPKAYGQVCIRIDSRNTAGTLQFIKEQWNKIYPEYPFEYHFLSDRISSLYKNEEAIGRLVEVFAVLAIFICSMGLFGLASFMTDRRSKEIGIRKVCGASIPLLVFRLTKEFLRLVIIALIIATPIAYFFITRWLGKFAYRTDISAWVIALTALLSLGIATITVGYHTLRTAQLNPATTLRYE
jgi:putative ABC transport system permease protein